MFPMHFWYDAGSEGPTQHENIQKIKWKSFLKFIVSKLDWWFLRYAKEKPSALVQAHLTSSLKWSGPIKDILVNVLMDLYLQEQTGLSSCNLWNKLTSRSSSSRKVWTYPILRLEKPNKIQNKDLICKILKLWGFMQSYYNDYVRYLLYQLLPISKKFYK